MGTCSVTQYANLQESYKLTYFKNCEQIEVVQLHSIQLIQGGIFLSQFFKTIVQLFFLFLTEIVLIKNVKKQANSCFHIPSTASLDLIYSIK